MALESYVPDMSERVPKTAPIFHVEIFLKGGQNRSVYGY